MRALNESCDTPKFRGVKACLQPPTGIRCAMGAAIEKYRKSGHVEEWILLHVLMCLPMGDAGHGYGFCERYDIHISALLPCGGALFA